MDKTVEMIEWLFTRHFLKNSITKKGKNNDSDVK